MAPTFFAGNSKAVLLKVILILGSYSALVAITLSTYRSSDRAQECESETIFEGHQCRVQSVAFAPDGKTLASAGGEYAVASEVFLWDTARRAELARLAPSRDMIACLAYSPDGRALALAGYDSSVTLWDTSIRQPRWS